MSGGTCGICFDTIVYLEYAVGMLKHAGINPNAVFGEFDVSALFCSNVNALALRSGALPRTPLLSKK